MMKMMKRTTRALWAGVLALGLTGAAQATLIDNGDGTVTDDSTGLMWLQDANYAQTSGHDADGRMNWDAAMAWAGGLSYGGYDDWRLPTVTDTGAPGCDWANSGTDCGYNVDTATGELAYLFHDILGNESWNNPDGTRNATGCPDADPWCVQNTGADGVNFLNMQSLAYWLGTEYAPNTDHAWYFRTYNGYQYNFSKSTELYAWAVRSGDVAGGGGGGTVPEPGTLLLMGAGLAGLAARRRR